jgi:hypothetical protein
MLLVINLIFLILKIKCAMDNIAIEEKEAKPIHAEGNMYIHYSHAISLQIIWW